MLRSAVRRITTIFGIIICILLGALPANVHAATFEFDPPSATINGCTTTVDLYIDTTGESAVAADVEFFYPTDTISLSDENGAQSGIQIEEGTVFPTYWGNQVDESTGQVLLSAGALSCTGPFTSASYVLTNTRTRYASVTLNYLGSTNGTITLDLRYDALGNTVDSNIASVLGTDLLNNDAVTNGGDGVYTFQPDETCEPVTTTGGSTGSTTGSTTTTSSTTGTTGTGTSDGDTTTDGETDSGTPTTDDGSTTGTTFEPQTTTTGQTTGGPLPSSGDTEPPGIPIAIVPFATLGCTSLAGIIFLIFAPRELIILAENASFATIYLSPKDEAEVIKAIPNEVEIEAISEQEGWYEVEYEDVHGWVRKEETKTRFKPIRRSDAETKELEAAITQTTS